MPTHFEPLDARVLLAAAPTRYDVTIADGKMAVVATGASASFSFSGNSHGGGVMEEEYYIDPPTLTVGGTLYVNGRRQPSPVLTFRFDVVQSLTRITYRGTPGRDEVYVNNEDAPFTGVFDLSTGAGNDRLDLNPGIGDWAARRVVIAGGAGDDRVLIYGTGPADVEVYTGAGRDKVYVSGTLDRFRLQDQSNATYLSITDATFSGGVQVLTGSQDDSLRITYSRFTRNTSIRTGGGHDTLTEGYNTLPRGASIDLGEDN